MTPSWLCGSFGSFLYIFLISSASVRSILFLYFNVPILNEMFPGISNFFEEISSVSHSFVFLYFFALVTEEDFLIFPCYSLELCIQMHISFLFSFAVCISSFHSICKASSDNYFAFFHLFFLGMVLITASCTISRTSIHSSSGTLSIRSNPLSISHFHCIIVRDLIKVIPEWSSAFPYFPQFKSSVQFSCSVVSDSL